MPRTSRKKRESGIYHIMLRGINRQKVFMDEDDNTLKEKGLSIRQISRLTGISFGIIRRK